MKIFRIVTSCFLAITIIFTIFFAKSQIAKKHVIANQAEYKGIITLWHIDAFEGGINSRKQFLSKVGARFEKENNGALVMITTHTIDSANKSLNEGKLPDIVSYSHGVDAQNLNELKVYSGSGGKINNKTYSAVWCSGGYYLISKRELKNYKQIKEYNLIISQNVYTLPALAISLEGIETGEYISLSPKQAYTKFISQKDDLLLGTQRDIYRLEGRGFSYYAYPLTQFSDINQYIAITATDVQKKVYAQKFIDILLSDSFQSNLSDIGMQSYADKKTKNTISIFTKKEEIISLQNLSYKAIAGDSEAQIKIKNYIVNS